MITGKPLLSVFHDISIAEIFSSGNDFSEMEGIIEETKIELRLIKLSEIQSQEVGHMNKVAGNKVTYWGVSLIDFFAVARSVLLVGIAPKANKIEQAKRLLREQAEMKDAIQSNEVFNLADEQDISKRTLENTKKELGVRAKRINNTWY